MPGMATSSGRSATPPVWWKGIDKAAQVGAVLRQSDGPRANAVSAGKFRPGIG
jgi:hypothetical protein